MVKRRHRFLSAALSALMVTGTLASALPASAAEVNEVKSEAAALYKQYSTNSAGFGVNKTMSIDGDISDWDSSMLIAQGAANDDPRVYVESSMHEIGLDLYALYAAYDDNKLYLMWEMTNVQDVVAPEQDYPLSQGHIYETQDGFNFNVAIDTGKSDSVIGNECRLPGKDRGEAKGNYLWDTNIGYTGNVNRIVVDNCKGWNGPFVYGGDSTGLNPVELIGKDQSKTEFAFGPGIISKEVIGINDAYGTSPVGDHHRVVGDVCDPSAKWTDFNTVGHDSAAYDYFYEMAIPYDELGITAADVKNNGIGVMLAVTSGRSGMDCLPYDITMNDNADKPDTESQEINSKEKSDEDIITVPFARVGKGGGTVNTDPDVPSDPDTDTQTDSDTDDTDSDTDILTLEGKKVDVVAKAGDTVTVKTTAKNSKDALGIWMSYNYDDTAMSYVKVESAMGTWVDSGKMKNTVGFNSMLTATGDDMTDETTVVTMTFKALKDIKNSDNVFAYVVKEFYDTSFDEFNHDNITVTASASGNIDTDTDPGFDPVPVSGKKVDVVAKKGDVVTLYTKASNAPSALGIFQEINYNSNALKFEEFISAEGSFMYNADIANQLMWNSLLDARGSDYSKETDVAVIKFVALADITSSDDVMAYEMIEFYDTSYNDYNTDDTIRCVAVTTHTDTDTDTVTDTDTQTDSDTDTQTDSDTDPDPIPVPGKKVDVVAKKGDVVTLYTKASNAPAALGIFQEINYNSNVLKFDEFVSAEGSFMYNADIANQLMWNSLLDARGSDYSKETDVAVIKFVALADITSSDDVMAYKMIEFYDTSFNDYNTDDTIRCVAVTTHTDTDTDTVTDTDTQTDSDTDTQTDSDTDTQTDSDTDTQTDSDTDTQTDSDTDTQTDSDTDTQTDSDTDTQTDSDTDTQTDSDTDTDSDPDVEMVVMGDANGDGNITIVDAVEILKYAMKILTPSDKQSFVSDVNGDGRITIADATDVQKYALKIPISGDVGKKKEYKPSK